MTALSVDEVLDLVEPCTFALGAEYDAGRTIIERCGQPSVEDEDEPRCEEHLTWQGREGMPEFNGAFG